MEILRCMQLEQQSAIVDNAIDKLLDCNLSSKYALTGRLRMSQVVYYFFTPPPIRKRCIMMCVSVSVCLCVCLSAVISLVISRPIFTRFFGMLPMTMARSSSGSIAILYVLLVLWMTSYLHITLPRLLDVTAVLRHSSHAAFGLAINGT